MLRPAHEALEMFLTRKSDGSLSAREGIDTIEHLYGDRDSEVRDLLIEILRDLEKGKEDRKKVYLLMAAVEAEREADNEKAS